MSFRIRKPGILTTVQDLGRTGYQSLGLNPGGVMDRTATRVLNTLLANNGNAAVLETHFPACEIEFETDTVVAIGGADFGATIDGKVIQNWSAISVAQGNVLKFTQRASGQRAYIAFRGGVRVDKWFGSRSTNLVARAGGHEGRSLREGDRLPCSRSNVTSQLRAAPSLIPRYNRFPTVRIIAGSEFDLLTAISERDLLSHGFSMSAQCDRMGYRLDGKPLHLLHRKSMISSAVTFGTIQLLPDGQLIVLLADHQTSGGYPRIANVISADLPLLAQCGPGDGVSFRLVTIDEAEQAGIQLERGLNFLRVGCRLLGHNANG